MTGVSDAFRIERMSIGARLKEAREKAGLSQEAIAVKMGISRAAVAQWEADTTVPEASKFARLAEILGVSTDWLLTGHEFQGVSDPQTGRYEHNTEPAPELRRLPIVSWVQAGRGQEAADPHPPGDGDGIAHTTKRLGPNAYALRIRGDSMEPRFHDGDIIVIDPAVQPRHGSYVVVRFEDRQEATFKQLMVDAGRKYLKPLNPRYPIEEIDGQATLCGTWVQTIVDGG